MSEHDLIPGLLHDPRLRFDHIDPNQKGKEGVEGQWGPALTDGMFGIPFNSTDGGPNISQWCRGNDPLWIGAGGTCAASSKHRVVNRAHKVSPRLDEEEAVVPENWAGEETLRFFCPGPLRIQFRSFHHGRKQPCSNFGLSNYYSYDVEPVRREVDYVVPSNLACVFSFDANGGRWPGAGFATSQWGGGPGSSSAWWPAQIDGHQFAEVGVSRWQRENPGRGDPWPHMHKALYVTYACVEPTPPPLTIGPTLGRAGSFSYQPDFTPSYPHYQWSGANTVYHYPVFSTDLVGKLVRTTNDNRIYICVGAQNLNPGDAACGPCGADTSTTACAGKPSECARRHRTSTYWKVGKDAGAVRYIFFRLMADDSDAGESALAIVPSTADEPLYSGLLSEVDGTASAFTSVSGNQQMHLGLHDTALESSAAAAAYVKRALLLWALRQIGATAEAVRDYESRTTPGLDTAGLPTQALDVAVAALKRGIAKVQITYGQTFEEYITWLAYNLYRDTAVTTTACPKGFVRRSGRCEFSMDKYREDFNTTCGRSAGLFAYLNMATGECDSFSPTVATYCLQDFEEPDTLAGWAAHFTATAVAVASGSHAVFGPSVRSPAAIAASDVPMAWSYRCKRTSKWDEEEARRCRAHQELQISRADGTMTCATDAAILETLKGDCRRSDPLTVYDEATGGCVPDDATIGALHDLCTSTYCRGDGCLLVFDETLESDDVSRPVTHTIPNLGRFTGYCVVDEARAAAITCRDDQFLNPSDGTCIVDRGMAQLLHRRCRTEYGFPYRHDFEEGICQPDADALTELARACQEMYADASGTPSPDWDVNPDTAIWDDKFFLYRLGPGRNACIYVGDGPPQQPVVVRGDGAGAGDGGGADDDADADNGAVVDPAPTVPAPAVPAPSIPAPVSDAAVPARFGLDDIEPSLLAGGAAAAALLAMLL